MQPPLKLMAFRSL